MNCTSEDLGNAIMALEGVRTELPRTSSDSEVPRLLAIARTHIETAELFIEKAADRLPSI